MKRTWIFWILSFVITIAAAYYQRITGPTYPLKGELNWDDGQFSYVLLRSHGGEGNAPVSISGGDKEIQGFVEWRRFKTNDDWSTVRMIRSEDGEFSAELPHQPPAGKLEYHIILAKGTSQRALPEKGTVVIRFKGDVPTGALIPHVIAMFAAMLLSTRSGLECFNRQVSFKQLVYWTVALLAIGGMILGPIVQKYAFGEYWTGIPFGTDLTDNKTLIAFVVWLAALVALRKSKHPERWIALASIVTFIIFLIPHSLFGSELNYSNQVQP